MSFIFPSLPPELIEEVILRAWELQCSVTERILLMTSLPLVSRGVLATYVRVSSSDVHIPCLSFVSGFLRGLHEGARRFPIIPAAGNTAELCRSITLQIVQPRSPDSTGNAEPPMGAVLSDLLYNLRLFGGPPNLRTLTIRYIDVDLDDTFDWARFIDFPATVEFLNLESVRTEGEVPSPKILFNSPGRFSDVILWTLPSVRHLRVSGGSKKLVSRLVSSMPNLESLDVRAGGMEARHR